MGPIIHGPIRPQRDLSLEVKWIMRMNPTYHWELAMCQTFVHAQFLILAATPLGTVTSDKGHRLTTQVMLKARIQLRAIQLQNSHSFHNRKTQKQPKCPTTNKWIN